MSKFATEDAHSFWTAWDGLRNGRTLPHYRDLFEGVPSALIPRMVILERAKDGYIVRFVGTGVVELWGSDHTGDNLTQVMPSAFLKGLSPLLDLARSYPCGVSSLANVETGRGIFVQLDVVVLPVANDPERPGRVVIFSSMLPRRNGDPLLTTTVRRANRVWIDLGCGVPENNILRQR